MTIVYGGVEVRVETALSVPVYSADGVDHLYDRVTIIGVAGPTTGVSAEDEAWLNRIGNI